MKPQKLMLAAAVAFVLSFSANAQSKKTTTKSENLKTQELQPVESEQELKSIPVQSQPMVQPAQVQQETKVETEEKQPAKQQELKATPVTKKTSKMAPKSKGEGSAKKAKK